MDWPTPPTAGSVRPSQPRYRECAVARLRRSGCRDLQSRQLQARRCGQPHTQPRRRPHCGTTRRQAHQLPARPLEPFIRELASASTAPRRRPRLTGKGQRGDQLRTDTPSGTPSRTDQRPQAGSPRGRSRGDADAYTGRLTTQGQHHQLSAACCRVNLVAGSALTHALQAAIH